MPTDEKAKVATPSVMGEASRMSAIGALDHMIDQKTRELRNLSALRQTLPQVLSDQADEALWKLIIERR